jgi:flagellar motor switch protein FliM
MSYESLSQTDIDRLFSGDEDMAPTRAAIVAAPLDVQVYDFKRPARISKDRKRSLQAIYSLCGKSFEGWLTSRTRDSLHFDLLSVEEISFGEFMLALPSPCAAYVVDVTNHPGSHGVVDFGLEFAYYLVDRMLGGSGEIVQMDRPLSAIERMVVRIVAERLTQQMADAWRDYIPLDLVVNGFESIPEMLSVMNREDPVLVANMEVRVDDISSICLVCLPFGILERFFSGDSNRREVTVQGSPEERLADRTRVESSIREARLTVAARLPTFHVPIKELFDLQEGQVLQTGLAPDAPLELLVSDQRRFVGSVGRIGRQLALRVEEPADPEPEMSIHPARELAFL